MAVCIACGKSFSCSCGMYKHKFCNQKCEAVYLEKLKKENEPLTGNSMHQLQQPEVASGQDN